LLEVFDTFSELSETASGFDTVKSKTFIGRPWTAAPMVPVTAPLKSTSSLSTAVLARFAGMKMISRSMPSSLKKPRWSAGVKREEGDVGRRAGHADFF
jgi:hypothetical protein